MTPLGLLWHAIKVVSFITPSVLLRNVTPDGIDPRNDVLGGVIILML